VHDAVWARTRVCNTCGTVSTLCSPSSSPASGVSEAPVSNSFSARYVWLWRTASDSALPPCLTASPSLLLTSYGATQLKNGGSELRWVRWREI